MRGAAHHGAGVRRDPPEAAGLCTPGEVRAASGCVSKQVIAGMGGRGWPASRGSPNGDGVINVKAADHDPGGRSAHLRTQKYVYLTRYFGPGLPYHYGMHLRGPYSSQLAEELDGLNGHAATQPLDFPKKAEFLGMARGRSDGWLDVATTILEAKGEIKRMNLLDYVEFTKPRYTREFIEQVYAEMPDGLKD